MGTRGSTFVDARFDAGYFVTTRLGRHEFKGGQDPLHSLMLLMFRLFCCPFDDFMNCSQYSMLVLHVQRRR